MSIYVTYHGISHALWPRLHVGRYTKAATSSALEARGATPHSPSAARPVDHLLELFFSSKTHLFVVVSYGNPSKIDENR